MYIKSEYDHVLIMVGYVDDIIFRNNMEWLGHQFAKCMDTNFEMSMTGGLSFFLGLQIFQSKDGIFISKSEYLREYTEEICTTILQAS